MYQGIATVSGSFTKMGLLRASQEVDFGITGYQEYTLFGHELYLTTTHISIIVVMLALIIFALVANRVIKKADPNKVPGTFLNIIEYIVEAIDNLTVANMGSKHGHKFSNYIGTLFMFILLSNLSGLFGLRPPTADYGTTLALALITFAMIHYNGFKYQKASHVTNLFKPLLLSPINIIGEIATPLSLSLRLFGNILSGTVLTGLIYGLLPKLLTLVWPGALHAYLDVFSGTIQAYVFCMLTMVFVSNTFEEE
ncbi:F-type H+-transporting ATPase subunit a [Anaerosporobacter mobilis DSM 15930]|uniref:ATP synthase subunit a n=2 Tax=Anaerosporobacter TaxID=653683 RepID=A0A1M7IZC6_9FIRM|nr:F0F1 ATP synthase subunit A [Anaerosporobacter mobilis]SHM46096.1 F-type H+-transporting ATPase subunit a [Anaerosporobacter mobilis DSM 15930]